MTNYSEWLWIKFREWEQSQHRRTSQMAFARYLGVSQPSLNHWMNGDNPPAGDSVHLLASKLGYEIYDILNIAPPYPPIVHEVIEAYNATPVDQQPEFQQRIQQVIHEWLEEHGFKRDK